MSTEPENRTTNRNLLWPASIDLLRSDGGRIRAWQWRRAEPCCVLLHGLADNGLLWSGFVESIPSDYGVLALDLRGHGDSAWDPNADYGLPAHVADVAHALDELSLRRVVLIGHSLGGDIAMSLAAARPAQVIGLVAVDVSELPCVEVETHVRNMIRETNRLYDSVAEYTALLERSRPTAPIDMLAELARLSLRPRPDGHYELKCDPAIALSDSSEGFNPSILAAIRCPTLLIRGEWSAVLSQATADRMARALRHARVAAVPSAGHDVMLGNPDGFNRAVVPFLDELLKFLRLSK